MFIKIGRYRWIAFRNQILYHRVDLIDIVELDIHLVDYVHIAR